MLNVLVRRKPIMKYKDENNGFRYKNCFTAYCLGVELEFETDLSELEFSDFLDGRYTREDIERFEMCGKF